MIVYRTFNNLENMNAEGQVKKSQRSGDAKDKAEDETLTRKTSKVNFKIQEAIQSEQESELTSSSSSSSSSSDLKDEDKGKAEAKKSNNQLILKATSKPKIPIIVMDKPNKSKVDDTKQISSKDDLDYEKIKRRVAIVFEFLNIGEIDTLNEKFQAEVAITSTWEIYSDRAVNADIFEKYDAKKHWNPQLYIENAIAVKQDIDYDTSIDGDQYFVTEKRNVKGSFWANMELKHVNNR